jgi:hypothetical protein
LPKLDYAQTLTSFSGADLIVSFGSRVIGELQQITWAIQRDKVPVYTLGSADPRSYSRGKRACAGSLIFAVFDRDALYDELVADDANWKSYAPPAMFTASGNLYTSTVGGIAETKRMNDFARAIEMSMWDTKTTEQYQVGTIGGGTSDIGSDEQTSVNTPPGFELIKRPNILYIDQIPPFNVTMTFANEYGQAAFQKIYDVEFLNEVSGVNIDTVIMERNLTFIARRVSPIIKGIYNVGGDNEIVPVQVVNS